jgi:hypothetical protein
MTHSWVSWRLLSGVAVLAVALSGLVWLARQQSRRARILILTQGGHPSRTVHPDGSDALQGACSFPSPIPSPPPPRCG